MVSFRELAKPVDDVLEKQFVHGKPWAVELQHELANPNLKETATMSTDGKLSCASSTGLQLGPVNVNGQFGGDGSAGVQLTYNSDILKGLSLHTNVQSAVTAVREQKIDMQAKFRADPWQLHGTLNPVNHNWGFAVIGKHQFAFEKTHTLSYAWDLAGTQLQTPALSGASVSYQYPVKDHVVTGMCSVSSYGKLHLGKVTFGAASQSANQSEMAVRYSYIPSEDRSELTVGAGWVLDPKTRNTSLKARIDQNANVAVSVTHKLNDNASVTIGTGFDGSKKITADTSAKIGFKLSLRA